uniref:Uncharacterized protein n=1 Tax=Paramormyrops kingsleyae TaxID=1676925 RepID=A0A3B3S062_9TELE
MEDHSERRTKVQGVSAASPLLVVNATSGGSFSPAWHVSSLNAERRCPHRNTKPEWTARDWGGGGGGGGLAEGRNQFRGWALASVHLCPSQELVLPQVHPLDDVPAVVEDAADVLRVHGAGEVRVAVMSPVSSLRGTYQELISNEILCSGDLWVFSGFRHGTVTIIRYGVARKFWEVFVDFGFPSQNFLSQQVLFVEEQYDRNAFVGVHFWVCPNVSGLPVVPDILEQVETTAGHNKNNGHSTIETLDPLASFISLSPHIKHTVGKIGREEQNQPQVLKQTSHVILKLLHLGDNVNELVFVGPLEARPDPLILPQRFGVFIELLKGETKITTCYVENVLDSELVLRTGELNWWYQCAHGCHNSLGGESTIFFYVVFYILNFLLLLSIKKNRHN